MSPETLHRRLGSIFAVLNMMRGEVFKIASAVQSLAIVAVQGNGIVVYRVGEKVLLLLKGAGSVVDEA